MRATRALQWLEAAAANDHDPRGTEPHTDAGERECQELAAAGYLRVADGGYRITDKGRDYLNETER